jgi:hypothetical protein
MSSVERDGSGAHHEVLSLAVSDVWQAGQVVDRVTVRRRHMKGQRAGRTVPLHPDAQAAIAVWLVDLKALVELTPATSASPAPCTTWTCVRSASTRLFWACKGEERWSDQPI